MFDMPIFPEAETVPAHVPADRIYDYDIYSERAPNGDFALFTTALQGKDVPDIFWTPKNGGHWMVTRGPDIDVVLNDAKHFSNRNLRVPKYANANPPLKPLQVDPPEHTKYRALLMGALSPKAVGSLSVGARELAIKLIDDMFEAGECDFVPAFAQQMPIAIFMAMVDLPLSDRPRLLKISDAVVRPATADERVKGLEDLKSYINQKVNERRANPGTDLISHLVQAKVDGEPLDEQSLTGMLVLVLLAGLDTVASMLTCFAKFLADNPEHRHQLIEDPSLITNAVEELLRRYAIVMLGREVAEDFELNGVLLKAGEMISCPTPLSNLDAEKFPDPLTVDFKRKIAAHATFGGGTHRCMGAMLARTELKIFLEEWLKRIPDFRVKPGAVIEATTDVTSVIPSLPLEWDVQALRKAA
jgi:cytochrome P450